MLSPSVEPRQLWVRSRLRVARSYHLQNTPGFKDPELRTHVYTWPIVDQLSEAWPSDATASIQHAALGYRSYAGRVEGGLGWCHAHCLVREVEGIKLLTATFKEEVATSRRFKCSHLHSRRSKIPPQNDSDNEESSSDDAVAAVA